MAWLAINYERQNERQKPDRMLAHSRFTRLYGLAPLILSVSLLGLSPQLHAAVACVSIDGGDPVCTEMPSPDLIIVPGGGGGGGGIGGGGELGGGGGGLPGLISVGNILVTAEQLLQLANDLASLTFLAAEADVRYFRETNGGHLPFSQGSLINWSAAEVNWSLYGADNLDLSEQQVVLNMINSVLNGP